MIESTLLCASSCLSFRYIADPSWAWSDRSCPAFPEEAAKTLRKVSTSDDIKRFLNERVVDIVTEKKAGILLSGGIDSAIIAAFLPEGTNAYTIRFEAPGAIDESIMAAEYAKRLKLKHHVVTVSWRDYEEREERLMKFKKSILHPVEVPLSKAAELAREHGLEGLIVGNGADSTFGGLDKLLSRDWDLEAFIQRYTFVMPSAVLKDPVSMDVIFKRYDRPGKPYDVSGFLKTIHGLGVIQAFDNAIRSSGMDIYEPYEELMLDIPLDLGKIRSGQPKYLLRGIFDELFDGMQIPEKIAFARPMDSWLAEWKGPEHRLFREELDCSGFTGDQKWIIRCLDRFLVSRGF